MLSTFGSPQLPRAGLAEPARATPGPVDTGVGAGAGPTVPGPGQHQPCSGSLETGLCPVTQCVVSWECAQRSRAEVRSCCSSKRERGGRLRDLWCGCHTPQRHRKGRARSGTRDRRRRPKAGQTRVPPEPSLENLRVHVRVCARACVRAWGRWGKSQHSNLVILFQSF